MEANNDESALTVMLDNLPLSASVVESIQGHELRAAIDSMLLSCEKDLVPEVIVQN
jgi:hypothetical protein